MGIVEQRLADFELSDGTEYEIEYNEGDKIHVHVNSMRLDLSLNEFQQLASVVGDAKTELERTKDLE